MAKIKKQYSCTECGVNSPKWIGQCPSCKSWNTYVEEIIGQDTVQEKRKALREDHPKKSNQPILVKDIDPLSITRIQTTDPEFNHILGGGIVPGSLVLIGGQPGIGKSTLLLQIALSLKGKILYVSGEESEQQIKMRANRMDFHNDNCYIYAEINLEKILKTAKKMSPDIMIIDSIQTLSSPYLDNTPGSITQIRECTTELQRFAKEMNIPTFVIGHITKEGSIAGPKVLEHIVDVVLQFEGDQNYSYRILRTLKNRFGSTDDIGIYEMKASGLKPVTNPSEMLLAQTDESLSGSAVSATLEGVRPLLIETQALVTPAIYGNPQRSSTGFDMRRLSMLLAVLEKRCGLSFSQSDVFLNIAGGLKISDPSIDLAIIAALISSLEDISIDRKICFAGEVGLSGEIRSVNRIEQRIQEADRLGFEQIFISKNNDKGLEPSKYNLEIKTISKIEHLLSDVFS